MYPVRYGFVVVIAVVIVVLVVMLVVVVVGRSLTYRRTSQDCHIITNRTLQ